MTLRVMPDVEAIAIAYLRDLEVTYGRIYGRIPAEPEFPLQTVTLAPSQVVAEFYLYGGALDITAWSPSKSEARDECAVALAALADPGFRGDHPPFGVVTGVAERVGMQWLPDPDTGHARYLAQVVVYAHPLPA
jgi:hypothetical protein